MQARAVHHTPDERLAAKRPGPIVHQYIITIVGQSQQSVINAVAALGAPYDIGIHCQAVLRHCLFKGRDIFFPRRDDDAPADLPQSFHAVADHGPARKRLQGLDRVPAHAGTRARRRDDSPNAHASPSPASKLMMQS